VRLLTIQYGETLSRGNSVTTVDLVALPTIRGMEEFGNAHKLDWFWFSVSSLCRAMATGVPSPESVHRGGLACGGSGI